MKKSNLFIAFAFGVSIFYAAYQSYTRNRLEKEGRYTIGITNGQQGKLIVYQFWVDNVEYNGKSRYSVKGSPSFYEGKYYVRYLPTDASVNEILLHEPVPENRIAPISGWESIPKN